MNPDKINMQGGGALENSIGTVQHVPLFLCNWLAKIMVE